MGFVQKMRIRRSIKKTVKEWENKGIEPDQLMDKLDTIIEIAKNWENIAKNSENTTLISEWMRKKELMKPETQIKKRISKANIGDAIALSGTIVVGSAEPPAHPASWVFIAGTIAIGIGVSLYNRFKAINIANKTNKKVDKYLEKLKAVITQTLYLASFVTAISTFKNVEFPLIKYPLTGIIGTYGVLMYFAQKIKDEMLKKIVKEKNV
ncbi:hypothetical protein KO465_02770 [Candidatus Micrarchaeota archaeon]|nr:hypothetical protein [Candidatus Micrarchaeota archaeon]